MRKPGMPIPPKPEGSRWTDEQWAAITEGGAHLLVSAAAGSGKTAVLVERIIRRVADAERPLDMNALLVATFTNAAAAEMKERIRRALEDALERSPDSRHLERQLALLPQAAITTLHSFCLEVVRRYATLIGLDPGFRIAGETEAELLRIDTLDELFERTYEAQGENGALARLAELFGGGGATRRCRSSFWICTPLPAAIPGRPIGSGRWRLSSAKPMRRHSPVPYGCGPCSATCG